MDNPLGSLRAVLVSGTSRDPALADDMDLPAYVETRDEALIKEREGMRAARFCLAPLKRGWVAEHVDSRDSASERHVMAFLGACYAIEMPDGSVKKAPMRQGPYGQRVAPIAWMEGAADEFGMRAVYEIGALAWQRAQLREGAKGPFF